MCFYFSAAVSDYTDCAEIAVLKNDARLIDGSFRLTESLRNGRPVYDHSDLDLSLYFYQDESCAFWAIGKEVDHKSSILYAYDISKSPEKIIGTVTTFAESGWEIDTNHTISIKCLTST